MATNEMPSVPEGVRQAGLSDSSAHQPTSRQRKAVPHTGEHHAATKRSIALTLPPAAGREGTVLRGGSSHERPRHVWLHGYEVSRRAGPQGREVAAWLTDWRRGRGADC